MPNLVTLASGDHDLADPVVQWYAHYVDGSHPPMVELLASLKVDPMLRGRLSRGTTATTLAIQMDAQVAIDLFARLRALAHSMGWPLPP
jgi:hypothetical protein